MPTELTIEAAMIELNRLKTEERMDIDRDRMAAASLRWRWTNAQFIILAILG